MTFGFGNQNKSVKLTKKDLQKIKSNPNHICNEYNGRTYAMQALVDGLDDTVFKLLKRDRIDVSATDKEGRSLMHLAVESKNKKLIELLIKKGADINLRDKKGKTPIFSYFSGVETYEYRGAPIKNEAEQEKNSKKYEEKEELDLKFAEWLIEKGADVNINDAKGNLPLHIAVENFGISTVSFLLANTKQVDKSNYTGIKPLHIAAENNSLDVVKKILHYRVDINSTDNRRKNILHYALFNSDDRVLNFLISNTDAVKMINSSDIEAKKTPFQIAIAEDKLAIVKKMINLGADLNKADKEGLSPLATAVENKLYKMSKMLISFGADVSGTSVLYNSIHSYNDDRRIFDLLMEYSPNVDAANKDGKTPLMRALEVGKTAIAKTLLDAGADVTKTTKNNKNVLFYLDYSCPKDLVERMIKQGADVKQVADNGITVLHENLFGNYNDEHVKLLVKYGADVNAKDKYDRVPLHHLLMYESNVKLAEWLIDNGADVDLKTEDNVTILHMVSGTEDAHKGLLEKVLKESKTDINATDDRGNTPIFYAVQERCLKNIRILLENGADPDIENKYRTSARSLSSKFYDKDMLKVFIEFEKEQARKGLSREFNNKKDKARKNSNDNNKINKNNKKPPKNNGGGFIV